ncbi:MAG: enoyl-CoA hydratase-related protein [Nitrospinota bacterium]|jgi:enoyl-CoA hydratase|nr:enoyl-CoA hydratase-related protein [Nitrospinota bacterium]MDP6367878.1 enoyl-CoA hydratase-related protein [Nitrospinota bacterium]MDP7168763.1 enoyl-CoA hydratase-related protein [Nitrospinota bacterium]|tara:strand:+ start:183 stop:965 length:783 start_codon:yes stop_codon:yes gene_type:complete
MDLTQEFGLRTVKYEKKAKIAYVTLNRPDKLNPLSFETVKELLRCWEDIHTDREIWVAILAGEGRSFCAGWDQDLEEDELILGAVRPKGILYCDLDWVKKPIICAAQGYAIGGGMSLFLGADVRIVSEDAKIGYSQPKIGIISIGGAMRLPAHLPGLARWYMLSGELIDAEEAYRLGLVVKVAPNGKLLEEATGLAEKIIECSPMAVQHTKEEIAVAANVSMYEGYRLCRPIMNRFYQTEDYREGKGAFMAKRKPVWKNC